MVRKIVLVALVSLASALLTACGGGSPSPSSYPYVTAPSPGTTASPTITVQPVAATAYETQTVTFSVTASGSGTLSYQWRKNGVDIGGATSANYVTTVTLADNGSQFSVTISNGLGTVTSNAAVLTVQAANVKSLVISEVASCFDPATDCWLEVYNPTSTGIDLATYQLKTGSLDVSSQAIAVATTFTLPSFTVAPGAYVVISGNVKNLVQRSSQMLRLRQGAQVPYWTGNGFIELLSAGATVDFVRFGSSNQAPVTSGQWTGPSVTALPSSTGDHGKAIVRPGAISIDTHSASDWSSVNWATPAGRNDVPIGALDADGDGRAAVEGLLQLNARLDDIRGRIEQIAAPQAIYSQPASRFVADFIGSVNLFDGKLTTDEVDHCAATTGIGEIHVGHGVSGALNMPVAVEERPEKIEISKTRPADVGFNLFTGKVKEIAYFGSYNSFIVQASNGQKVKITEANTSRHDLSHITWEDEVFFWWGDRAGIVLRD